MHFDVDMLFALDKLVDADDRFFARFLAQRRRAAFALPS
jgi:hypothetical protein